MSLNSLSNASLRQLIIQNTKTKPGLEAGNVLSPIAVTEARASIAVDENSANKVINALVQYIPTEMLASFVAAISMAPTFNWNVKLLYVIWIIATPLVYLLIYYSKLASEGKPWPSFTAAAFKRNVYFALAATVAFVIWGLTVPTGVVSKDIGPVLAAFLASIVSPLLSFLQPIVFRIIGEDPAS